MNLQKNLISRKQVLYVSQCYGFLHLYLEIILLIEISTETQIYTFK